MKQITHTVGFDIILESIHSFMKVCTSKRDNLILVPVFKHVIKGSQLGKIEEPKGLVQMLNPNIESGLIPPGHLGLVVVYGDESIWCNAKFLKVALIEIKSNEEIGQEKNSIHFLCKRELISATYIDHETFGLLRSFDVCGVRDFEDIEDLKRHVSRLEYFFERLIEDFERGFDFEYLHTIGARI